MNEKKHKQYDCPHNQSTFDSEFDDNINQLNDYSGHNTKDFYLIFKPKFIGLSQ